MLKLAVCDDSQLFLQEMKAMLEADARVGNVSCYERPEQLLEVIERGEKELDAVFMDIEFDRDGNGITYGKKIFQRAPQIQVVYVTGYHDRYIQQIFLTETNLTGYLMKPLEQKLLGQYLSRIQEKRKPKHVFTFSVRGKSHIIASDCILYLESDNHKVLIHTEDGSYTVYDKLSNLQKQLPSSFIQCHKSFLVNMEQIRHLEGNEICFRDGRRVPISKIHQERVRKSYFLHLGKTI